ncbi:LamG domain-containing protein, partial [Candidatus Dependentiae bacterium]
LIDNFVAGWELNESSGNAADVLGSTTLTNDNSVSYAAGLFDNAASFDTGNRRLTNTSTSIGLTDSGGYTWSMWVKITTMGDCYLFDHLGTSGGNNRIIGYINGGTSSLRAYVGNDVNAGTNSLTTNTWYHIVYTRSGTTVRIYLDAVEKVNGTSTNWNGGTNFTLGNNYSANSNTAGVKLIDRCYLWDRALSGSEITELYNGGAGLAYPFSAPASSPTAGFFAGYLSQQ